MKVMSQARFRILLILIGLQVLVAFPALAGNVQFGGILPGGGVIRKNIISMHERQYLNLVRQKTDYSCGAAAVATILKFGYGIDTTEEDVLRGMLKVSDAQQARSKGFSMLNMKHYLKRLGLRARGYRVPAAKLENVRMPVIVLLNLKGYNHFVVFKKSTNGQVYIADPALGNKVLDKEEFLAGWNGVAFAIIHQDFDWESILLEPDEPLIASKTRALELVRQRVPVEIGNIQVRRYFTCLACL